MGRCHPTPTLTPEEVQAAADAVAQLPPLTPDQLDALCDTLATIRAGAQE